MKTAIYCFSGTGNNLMIAKRLSALIGETDIFPIRVLKDNKTISPEYEWVGFVTPAYYSHIPFRYLYIHKHLLDKEQLPNLPFHLQEFSLSLLQYKEYNLHIW